MAKGIKFPITITPRGGAELVESHRIIAQIIMLALLPASNMNPWNQELTPKEDVIFDIADNQVGNALKSHIYSLFDELERLGFASLQKENPITVDLVDSMTGDVNVKIRYIDLEDEQSREVVIPGRR